MNHITLPQRYYLHHVFELSAYLLDYCNHLLDAEARALLQQFNSLDQESQCLLVRIWSRKPTFIKVTSLDYPEISATARCLKTLAELGLISPASERPITANLLHSLTKKELLTLISQRQQNVTSSATKSGLIAAYLATANVSKFTDTTQTVLDAYIERRHERALSYCLFLFFGNLKHSLSSFVMRDLGVLSTRKKKPNQQRVARFETRATAELAFNCHWYIRALGQQALKVEAIIAFLEQTSHHRHAARDELVVLLGQHLYSVDPRRAEYVYSLSEHPKAIEKRLRLAYKNGPRERIKTELEQLMTQTLPASAQVFIDDFYARKFLKKRTSVYTDMLVNAPHPIALDEAYINTVEKGVQRYLAARGATVWYVENGLWRALFCLVLWEVLFTRVTQQACEFDRLPLPLQDEAFYQNHRPTIEACLSLLDDPERAIKVITARVTRHYGFPNGLFKWRSTVLEPLLELIHYAPPKALAHVLRRLAQNYKLNNDGYPDLMVVDQGKLRFVEVKAPGDTVRPNQLVSILSLRKAGFQADIQAVEWSIDPAQTYAVVDIETTGGRKSGNNITEIGIVKVRNQTIVGEWSTLVYPNRTIPAHITRLTGISNEMVLNAPRFSEIADTLEEQLKDCIFVAHNVGFDYGFIEAAYTQINRAFRHPKLCTVKLARKTFPGISSYSLGNLVSYFDIPLKNHHRALEDARATAHLLSLIQAQSQTQARINSHLKTRANRQFKTTRASAE